MTIQIDVLGFEYDDAEPAFIQRDGYYFHLKTHMKYDKPSFAKWLTAEGLTLGAKEVGTVSSQYEANHLWGGLLVGKTTAAVTPAPITVSVTKAPTAVNDDTGEVTVAGGPADKAYTVTLTVKGQASAGDDVQNVSIAKGATAAAAAAAIAAASSDPGVTATAKGAVITFTPKAGAQVSKLTVSIA